MRTIVPTSCIMVDGTPIRQWRKLYRNKIKMFGRSWTEHIYEFTPVSCPIINGDYVYRLDSIGKYEIRIYKNSGGDIIWATGRDSWCGTNGLWPSLNQGRKGFISSGKSILTKSDWKRSFTDVKMLLSLERVRENFVTGVTKYRKTYLLFPSKEVEQAVQTAIEAAESGRGRQRVGAYSGPASLSLDELKALGVRICHKKPTKKYPKEASGDYVREGLNWGSEVPEESMWFRYGAGYHYNGPTGCNAGWQWYE